MTFNYIMHQLNNSLDKEYLDKFQIVVDDATVEVPEELKEDKYRVLYVPEMNSKNLARSREFHRIVFVSNWQAHTLIQLHQLPWSKCVVMNDAIDPMKAVLAKKPKQADNAKFVYTTDAHKGLNLLLAAFDKLSEKYKEIELHVYCDVPDELRQLKEFMEGHPQVYHHNDKILNSIFRQELPTYDVWVYPAIYQDASCIQLIEAMSAKLQCIHPNFGGLFEVSANWTAAYNWNEILSEHAKILYYVMENAMIIAKNEHLDIKLTNQKAYADIFYNWENRLNYWKGFLDSIILSNEPKEIPKEQFTYTIK